MKTYLNKRKVPLLTPNLDQGSFFSGNALNFCKQILYFLAAVAYKFESMVLTNPNLPKMILREIIWIVL